MGWMRKNEGPVSPTGHNDRVRLVWSKLLLAAAAAASSKQQAAIRTAAAAGSSPLHTSRTW